MPVCHNQSKNYNNNQYIYINPNEFCLQGNRLPVRNCVLPLLLLLLLLLLLHRHLLRPSPLWCHQTRSWAASKYREPAPGVNLVALDLTCWLSRAQFCHQVNLLVIIVVLLLLLHRLVDRGLGDPCAGPESLSLLRTELRNLWLPLDPQPRWSEGGEGKERERCCWFVCCCQQ